jgi:hypothetical protein
MKSAWISIVLLLVACKNGGGTGGGGGSPNNRPHCDALVGSCDSNDGSTCAEYGGSVDPVQSQDACETGGSATWSTAGCDNAAFVGGCLYEVAGTCSIQWYPAAGYTAAQVQGSCEQAGGEFLP